MLYGTFNSNEGKYCFNGRWYKPRWMANAIKNRDWVDIYNICIQGYDTPVGESLDHWPKAVLVVCNLGGKYNLWEQIAKSYSGLYAQSQLHYYDASIPAGQVPTWANAWKASGNLLMHEYKAGKVVWLREGNFDNDIYIFMEDCDPPAETSDTGTTPSDTGDTTTPTPTVTTVSGGLFPLNSKTTIKWEQLGTGSVVPTEITVLPVS